MKKIFTFIFFSIISIFGYCDDTQVLASSNAIESAPKITKGNHDNNTYKLIQLKNGLRVLLISDPDSDKAAASMRVFAGQYDDPENALGVAHFTEHMLFLGNTKYPNHEKYEKFISQNKGEWNAGTDLRETVYYFDILQEHLEKALDMFSGFFISPLFLQDKNSIENEMIEKEKHAVDSEFKSKFKLDSRRAFYVDKETANPKHPYSKFSAGNLETLSSDDNGSLTQKVKNFYKKHYFAQNMVLTLYGPQPINELENMADLFSGIKSRELEPASYKATPIYRKEDLQKLITIQLEEDEYSLELRFPIPHHMKQYRTSAAKYIAEMLNRKDQGSLYDALKENNWINTTSGVVASYRNASDDTSFFDIDFSLTPEGFENYQEIIGKTFAYLQRVKTEGIDEWRFNEMKTIAQQAFDSATKKSPIDIVTATTKYINDSPIKDLLSANQLFFDYDQAEIKKLLQEKIVPSNMRVKHMAKDVLKGETEKDHQVEKCYQVPYKIEGILDDLLNQWKNLTIDETHQLRGQNFYISNNPINLLHTGDKQLNFSPTQKHSDNSKALWYLPDQFFKNPKINLQSILLTPLFSDTIENYLLANLYTELLQEQINIQYASAIDALNIIKVNWKRYGLSVEIEGYYLQKLTEIHTEVINDIMENFKPLEKRFSAIKDKKTRKYADALLYQPRDIVNETRAKLSLGSYSSKELSNAIQQINFKQLQSFINKLKADKFVLRRFTYGNIDAPL